jgi:hypothetical protein
MLQENNESLFYLFIKYNNIILLLILIYLIYLNQQKLFNK